MGRYANTDGLCISGSRDREGSSRNNGRGHITGGIFNFQVTVTVAGGLCSGSSRLALIYRLNRE